MKTNLKRGAGILRTVGVILVALLAGGCPDNSPPPAGTPTPAGAGGKIVIRGSNTIGEELAPALIAEFKKDHPAAEFEVDTKATGYGLAALRAGKCDIAGASREVTAEEKTEADTYKVQMNDHVIGSYCVAVIVNGNNPVSGLTKEQVRDIFTGAITNWKDLGGPDAAIVLYIRDPISGTYLGFREMAMGDKPYVSGAKLKTSYASIAEAVAQDANGIGYSSIALATAQGVKGVSIGGVAPTVGSVNDGKYPYTRKLRLYTNKAKESGQASEFIQYVQSAKGQQVLAQMGFVPHP